MLGEIEYEWEESVLAIIRRERRGRVEKEKRGGIKGKERV